ncbi:MAG: endonuclease [Acidobacteriaceae bacterium]|jgi:endonuclease-8|nr:endonuclease [Acidobacteriaceae bacterium]
MPEGHTIYRAARTLDLALAGQTITSFESALPHLSRVEVDHGVVGRIVEKVAAQGKWLLMYFSGELILLSHMRMSGSWHIYRPGETWKRWRYDMRVVLGTPKILAVAFNVPIAEFHTAASLTRREGFKSVGPSTLAENLDESEGIARLRAHPDLEIGVSLLTQSLVSGIGNVFKSEICFACGINPFRTVSDLTDDDLKCVVSKARKFMLANVTEASGDKITTYVPMCRTTGRASVWERLWVYKRTGEPCRRCRGAIVSRKQGLDARTSFWCPRCQPMGMKRASA